MIAALGLWQAGAVLVPINTRFEDAEAVLLLNGSGNRDERKFRDPDRFDLHRTIDHHLAFGYGIHFCLGAALARLEGRVALDEVLKRFPSWEIDCDNAVQARTSTVRGPGEPPGLHVLIDDARRSGSTGAVSSTDRWFLCCGAG